MAIVFKDAAAFSVIVEAHDYRAIRTGILSTPLESILLQNVFATDEDFASISDENEEDEYEVGTDDSLCVTVGNDSVKTLTLRLNGCNNILADLIRLKKLRPGGPGTPRTVFRLILNDATSGTSLISNQAVMISNPSYDIGNSNSTKEVVFKLTEIVDNNSFVNTLSALNTRVANPTILT